MALPKSLTQPLRQGQLSVGSGWRAYFAPFNTQQAVLNNSSVIGPKIFDLQVVGKWLDSNPPAGWFDMGYVKGVKMTPGSKTGNVVTGYRGAIRAKYQAEVGEKVSIAFQEMSRIALKISSGRQVFNALYSTATASTSGPLSSSGSVTSAMGASGYLATGGPSGPTMGLPTLCVPAGSGSLFPAGTFLVCDQDYNGTSYGFIGDAGATLFQGASTDVDFIRKTSDYVACVSSVVAGAFSGQDALILTGPFVGGGNSAAGTPNYVPTTGAKVQRILGIVAREGGSAIMEWSAILVLDTIDASQFLFYYPRLSPDQYAGITDEALQNASSVMGHAQQASFDAMAFDDPLDGETVVRYQAYYPHPTLNLQI